MSTKRELRKQIRGLQRELADLESENYEVSVDMPGHFPFRKGLKKVNVSMPPIVRIDFRGKHVEMWSGEYCFDLELESHVFDRPFQVLIKGAY